MFDRISAAAIAAVAGGVIVGGALAGNEVLKKYDQPRSACSKEPK